MSTLKAHDFCGKNVVDSREVAAMVDKQHKNLLADIRGYVEILEESAELKFQPGEFFIESSYFDSNNQERPNFLITKRGCDLIAHKLTGKKGVLFTAAYITAFEDMEKKLKNVEFFPSNVSLNGLSNYLETLRRIMLESGDTPQTVREMAVKTLCSLRVPIPDPLQQSAQLNLFSPDYQQMLKGA